MGELQTIDLTQVHLSGIEIGVCGQRCSSFDTKTATAAAAATTTSASTQVAWRAAAESQLSRLSMQTPAATLASQCCSRSQRCPLEKRTGVATRAFHDNLGEPSVSEQLVHTLQTHTHTLIRIKWPSEVLALRQRFEFVLA